MCGRVNKILEVLSRIINLPVNDRMGVRSPYLVNSIQVNKLQAGRRCNTTPPAVISLYPPITPNSVEPFWIKFDPGEIHSQDF
jgi:hypothetical protein